MKKRTLGEAENKEKGSNGNKRRIKSNIIHIDI